MPRPFSPWEDAFIIKHWSDHGTTEIGKLLKRTGAGIRKRGTMILCLPSKSNYIMDEERKHIWILYSDGESINGIADKLDRKRESIRNAIKNIPPGMLTKRENNIVAKADLQKAPKIPPAPESYVSDFIKPPTMAQLMARR